MGSLSIFHWLVVIAIIVAIVIITKYTFSQNSKKIGTVNGIGGWMILPIIGFFGAIILTTYNLALALKSIDGLYLIFSSNSGPLIKLKFPVFMSFFFGFMIIGSALFCLYYIFNKKSGVKNIATLHYILLATAGIVELWADGELQSVMPDIPSDPSVFSGAVRNILIAFIWISYFQLSKRVRNTFELNKINPEQTDVVPVAMKNQE